MIILKDDFIHINKKKDNDEKLKRQESYIKRRRIKEEYKEYLKDTLEHLQSKYFTIHSLRDRLVNEHSELIPVRISTLVKIIKMKYNYKKSEFCNPRLFANKIITSFFENSTFIMKLETEGIEVIYIKRFSLRSK